MDYTARQRMLNAYRGEFSDRYPVAPEFWAYYPAKVLGVDMIEFEREIPHWKALQKIFKRHNCEGWGIAGPTVTNPLQSNTSSFDKITDSEYCLTSKTVYRGHEFVIRQNYSKSEPSWLTEYPVKDESDLATFVDMLLDSENIYDFTPANDAREAVADDYLLEMMLGGPFFDFIAGAMGFENAVFLFSAGNEETLMEMRTRYVDNRLKFVQQACRETNFEAFFIGCSYSCNSLIGPGMWRQWDKPFLKAMADELHRHGKLLHIHFHGKCVESLQDFVDIGVDCVCPFERPPGGDIAGTEGLEKVRSILGGNVTMNGNVHTVETLIRGTPESVQQEVVQIKQAFQGEPRLIIGSGDQIGYETPEENVYALIEEAKRI